MTNSSLLEDTYYKWLKEKLIFQELPDDYVSISTPFLDNNYDNINLYAKFIDTDTIEISDFGYTLYNLSDAGVEITKRSKNIWNIFQQILHSFGVSQNDETLFIKTDLEKFPLAKNRLLQAILRINDLRYLSRDNVRRSFNDIMVSWFKENKILFTPDFEIATEDGISSHFDFSIPSSSSKEKLIKTVGRPNDLGQAKIFNYDVKAVAPERDADFILVFDDYSHKSNVTSETKAAALKDLGGSAEVVTYSDLLDKKFLLNN